MQDKPKLALSLAQLSPSLLLTIVNICEYCQAQPKPQPANPQLGAELALFSQLWGTYTNTLHPE